MSVLRAQLFSLTIAGLMVGSVFAQAGREDPEWLAQSPKVGEPFPDVTVYTPDGKEFQTSGLRGHYTVVAFGCLT